VNFARQSLKEEVSENPFSEFYWLTLEEAIRRGDSETVTEM